MSTTNYFNVHKGIDYLITAKARGYYDFRQAVTAQGGTLNYDMTPYDGLSYEIDKSLNALRSMEMNFENTKLPYADITISKLINDKYCLRPTGHNYLLPKFRKTFKNFWTGSGQNLIIQDNKLSGFSDYDYLLYSYSGNVDREVVLKIKYKYTNTQRFLSWYNSNACICFSSSNKLYMSTASGWQEGPTVFQDGQDYYIRLTLNANTLAVGLQSSTDGKTWNDELSYTYSSYPSDSRIIIGTDLAYYSGTGRYFQGEIYLNESYLTIDGKKITFDNEYTRNYDINITKAMHLVTDIDGAIYNFSSSYVGYINVPTVSINDKENFKIKFWAENGEYSGFVTIKNLLYFSISNSKLVVNYKTSESSGYTSKSLDMKSNNRYQVELIKKTEGFTMKLTDLFADPQTSTEVDCADAYYPNGTYSCDILKSNAGNYSYGVMVYYTEIPGLKTRTDSVTGILDSDYVDTGAAKDLNAFSDSNKYIVLSEKENYNNFTWLGTVNIPEHIVFNEPAE